MRAPTFCGFTGACRDCEATHLELGLATAWHMGFYFPELEPRDQPLCVHWLSGGEPPRLEILRGVRRIYLAGALRVASSIDLPSEVAATLELA